MKQHSKEFEKEITLLGKQQVVQITYGDVVLTSEDINSATPSYEANLLKSVMKSLVLDSNKDIPLRTEINFKYGLLVNGEYEYLDYGTYIVYSSERKEDTRSYEIKCYDKMLWSMKDYEKLDVTYPCTIVKFINTLCKKLGYTLGTTDFANKDRQLKDDVFDGINYTFRDVLDQIAEATASTIYVKDSTLILGQHFTFDKVTSTDNMFKNVPTLKERTTNETLAVNCNPGEYIKKVTKTDITSAPTTISGIAESDLTSLFENNTTITEINLANLDLTYTKNFSKMFKGCSKLKRLVFNDTIKLSGNTTTDMFTGMTALYRIKPDGSREQLTTSVTDLSGVWSAVNAKPKFYNGGKIECNSYTEMPSSNTNPTRMYNIGTLYTITLKEDSTATKQSIAPTRVVTGKEIIEKYTY